MNVTFSLGHKRFIIADYVFFLLIFILMGILRPDLIMISAYGLLFIYLSPDENLHFIISVLHRLFR